MGLWTVAFVLMTVFQCGTRFSAGWDGTYLQYCKLSNPSIEGMAASDAVLDLLVILVPVYPVRKAPTYSSLSPFLKKKDQLLYILTTGCRF